MDHEAASELTVLWEGTKILEDMEITVDQELYRDFSQLCAELGVTPEHCLERMFVWIAENPEEAMAYIQEAVAEQREVAES